MPETNYASGQYVPSIGELETQGPGSLITHKRSPLRVAIRDVTTAAADPDDPLGTLTAEASSPNHLVLQTGGARWLSLNVFHENTLTTAPVFRAYGLVPDTQRSDKFSPHTLAFVENPVGDAVLRGVYAVPLRDSDDSFSLAGFSTTAEMVSDTANKAYQVTSRGPYLFVGSVEEVIILTSTAAVVTSSDAAALVTQEIF